MNSLMNKTKTEFQRFENKLIKYFSQCRTGKKMLIVTLILLISLLYIYTLLCVGVITMVNSIPLEQRIQMMRG